MDFNEIVIDHKAVQPTIMTLCYYCYPVVK